MYVVTVRRCIQGFHCVVDFLAPRLVTHVAVAIDNLEKRPDRLLNTLREVLSLGLDGGPQNLSPKVGKCRVPPDVKSATEGPVLQHTCFDPQSGNTLVEWTMTRR